MTTLTPEEVLFTPMSEQEEQALLDNFEAVDWPSDRIEYLNTDLEKDLLKSEQSINLKNTNPKSVERDYELPDDLPTGITPPDVYHW